MVDRYRRCPKCGTPVETYVNPIPTVDAIIEYKGNDRKEGIVLIFRKNEPYKWALPGGFVEYGETLKEAACREAEEETSLKVNVIRQFHTYSDPERDPRHHTISTVYIAVATGIPHANDDAARIGVFNRDTLPDEIAFDHRNILEDYFAEREKS